jgi:hypothetical protein
MKREDARAAYYEFSGKLSDIARQLSFAGIALIWLFHVDAGGKPQVEGRLWQGIVFIVVALSSDFLQYSYQTAAWGIFNRVQERRGHSPATEFHAPIWLNWPALAFFWVKILAVGLAYAWILRSLAKRFVVLS